MKVFALRIQKKNQLGLNFFGQFNYDKQANAENICHPQLYVYV